MQQWIDDSIIKRQSLTVTEKQASMGKLFDWSKNFTGHMFNIKLDEKLHKIGSDRFKMDYQRIRNV